MLMKAGGREDTKNENHNHESGFTLLELTIALAVISALASGWYQWKQSVLRESITQRTVDGIVLIEEALYSYRLDQRPTPVDPAFPYEWPGSLGALDPYLPGIADGRNGVGQSYDIIPPTAPVMRTTPIKIKTDMLTAERAEDVARLFPLNGKIGSLDTPPLADTWVVVVVPVPGHEAAREAMLARDGAKDMRGDLDMGSHNIVGVDDEIVIGGEGLNTDDVNLLNQMSALNCSNAIQINAGTAQCAPPPKCRICYEVQNWGDLSQCGASSTGCGGWTTDADRWTAFLLDDTDDRAGGCRRRYKIECQ